jgi:hypothetical protein
MQSKKHRENVSKMRGRKGKSDEDDVSSPHSPDASRQSDFSLLSLPYVCLLPTI